MCWRLEGGEGAGVAEWRGEAVQKKRIFPTESDAARQPGPSAQGAAAMQAAGPRVEPAQPSSHPTAAPLQRKIRHGGAGGG